MKSFFMNVNLIELNLVVKGKRIFKIKKSEVK